MGYLSEMKWDGKKKENKWNELIFVVVNLVVKIGTLKGYWFDI